MDLQIPERYEYPFVKKEPSVAQGSEQPMNSPVVTEKPSDPPASSGKMSQLCQATLVMSVLQGNETFIWPLQDPL